MAVLDGTNRTQRLVLGFFIVVWASLVAILVADPQIYESTLKLGPGAHRLADLAFLIGLSALITVIAVGVLRRWRWVFWLITIAFLFGVLRVLATVLELSGAWPEVGPAWYAVLQAGIGAAQFVIALAMITGYRKAGVWGAF
jgi:hypothetical protein